MPTSICSISRTTLWHLSGLAWVNELLHSPNPHQIQDDLGVNQVAFFGMLENLIKRSGFHNDHKVFFDDRKWPQGLC
jgi:hypothetical protein